MAAVCSAGIATGRPAEIATEMTDENATGMIAEIALTTAEEEKIDPEIATDPQDNFLETAPRAAIEIGTETETDTETETEIPIDRPSGINLPHQNPNRQQPHRPRRHREERK